jgi:L-cysteine desulfidase
VLISTSGVLNVSSDGRLRGINLSDMADSGSGYVVARGPVKNYSEEKLNSLASLSRASSSLGILSSVSP